MKSIALLCCLVVLGGCRTASTLGVDRRASFLSSAFDSVDGFRDDETIKLTRFAYLGRVSSEQGPLYVVDVRSVIPSMPSPRGQSYLLFFDEEAVCLGKQPYSLSAPPGWCVGSKVYLYGADRWYGDTEGNAWDLAHGFEARVLVKDSMPGSWVPAPSGALGEPVQ